VTAVSVISGCQIDCSTFKTHLKHLMRSFKYRGRYYRFVRNNFLVRTVLTIFFSCYKPL